MGNSCFPHYLCIFHINNRLKASANFSKLQITFVGKGVSYTIRIDYIREFITLADSLSFSRASEDLYITQPSLSRHVSLLETELGVRLLERNTRNVSLTRAGSELYGDFVRLLDDYRAAVDHAKMISSGYSELLRISTPRNWLAEYTEPIILRFSRQYPAIKVEPDICDPVRGLDRLRRGISDLAIGFEPETFYPDLIWKKIFEARMCAVMESSHPLSGRTCVSLKDLSDGRFVVPEMDESRSRLRSGLESLLQRHGIDSSRFVSSRDLDTVGLSIRQTGAVCVLLGSPGNVGHSPLVSVPLSDPDCVRSLYLFRKKDSKNKGVNTFFDIAPPFSH